MLENQGEARAAGPAISGAQETLTEYKWEIVHVDEFKFTEHLKGGVSRCKGILKKTTSFWQRCAILLLGLLVAALLMIVLVLAAVAGPALVIVFGIVLPGLGIGFLLALAIGHTAALGVMVCLTLGFLLLALACMLGKNVAWERKLINAKRGMALAMIFLTWTLVYAAAAPLPYLRHGFAGDTSSTWGWALFFLDQTVDVALLGFLQYTGHFSGITPVEPFAKGIASIYRFCVLYGVWRIVTVGYRLTYKRFRLGGTKTYFFGTLEQLLAHLFGLGYSHKDRISFEDAQPAPAESPGGPVQDVALRVRRLGKITPILAADVLTEEDVKRAIPLALKRYKPLL